MKTQTQQGIEDGEEVVTLYRVFGYFYTEKDGQTWSPYLKRNVPCQVWNDNKELSEKTLSECSINSFNQKDLEEVMINFLTKDKDCLVVELQTCLMLKSAWDWAKGIDEQKVSNQRKQSHFAYENGAQDLDEYVCNEVGYNWKSKGVAFRLDGQKIQKDEMDELFDYFEEEIENVQQEVQTNITMTLSVNAGLSKLQIENALNKCFKNLIISNNIEVMGISINSTKEEKEVYNNE